MAAHLDGKDFTKEQWSRIESFAKFVKQEDTKQIHRQNSYYITLIAGRDII